MDPDDLSPTDRRSTRLHRSSAMRDSIMEESDKPAEAGKSPPRSPDASPGAGPLVLPGEGASMVPVAEQDQDLCHPDSEPEDEEQGKIFNFLF